MRNINHPDFFEKFEIAQHTVGQIGYGYIGTAVAELFRPHTEVLVYDKAKPMNLLDDVVRHSTVIFVAVPTPMNRDGSCHTGVVESVLQDVQNTALRVGRSVDDFIVVLKSTVPPGFTRDISSRLSLRVLFSPEFLTEANSVRDFRTASRVLLGGHMDDAAIVYKFFEAVWVDRVPENYVDHPDGPVNIVSCDSTTAETVKYFTNCYLATVVTFANEFAGLCEHLGIDYDIMKTLALLDQRISPSHLMVPGPDGKRGFGGSCFPKDVNSITHVLGALGCDPDFFRTVVRRNEVHRPSRDWEQLKGRAIVDE